MKAQALQENLRRILWQRIESGDVTGLKLAEQTGFQQAHVSNFLNRKRSLSIEGLDRFLSAQHLSVLDLLDQAEINRRASVEPPSEDEFENVAVVDGRVAATEAVIVSEKVLEIYKYKKNFLRRLRTEMASAARQRWRRFVVIRADAREGMSMYPRLLPGATVLIDRHYNALKPYRRGEQNMYAVEKEGGCAIKYVQVVADSLVLRPQNNAYPVDEIGRAHV
ncbi:MAG: S24 family peptidase [Acidobacteriaceae bacterium]|nr:S24 family peptidase [Acidobacteriaceae bacterium]